MQNKMNITAMIHEQVQRERERELGQQRRPQSPGRPLSGDIRHSLAVQIASNTTSSPLSTFKQPSGGRNEPQPGQTEPHPVVSPTESDPPKRKASKKERRKASDSLSDADDERQVAESLSRRGSKKNTRPSVPLSLLDTVDHEEFEGFSPQKDSNKEASLLIVEKAGAVVNEGNPRKGIKNIPQEHSKTQETPQLAGDPVNTSEQRSRKGSKNNDAKMMNRSCPLTEEEGLLAGPSKQTESAPQINILDHKTSMDSARLAKDEPISAATATTAVATGSGADSSNMNLPVPSSISEAPSISIKEENKNPLSTVSSSLNRADSDDDILATLDELDAPSQPHPTLAPAPTSALTPSLPDPAPTSTAPVSVSASVVLQHTQSGPPFESQSQQQSLPDNEDSLYIPDFDSEESLSTGTPFPHLIKSHSFVKNEIHPHVHPPPLEIEVTVATPTEEPPSILPTPTVQITPLVNRTVSFEDRADLPRSFQQRLTEEELNESPDPRHLASAEAPSRSSSRGLKRPPPSNKLLNDSEGGSSGFLQARNEVFASLLLNSPSEIAKDGNSQSLVDEATQSPPKDGEEMAPKERDENSVEDGDRKDRRKRAVESQRKGKSKASEKEKNDKRKSKRKDDSSESPKRERKKDSKASDASMASQPSSSSYSMSSTASTISAIVSLFTAKK